MFQRLCQSPVPFNEIAGPATRSTVVQRIVFAVVFPIHTTSWCRFEPTAVGFSSRRSTIELRPINLDTSGFLALIQNQTLASSISNRLILCETALKEITRIIETIASPGLRCVSELLLESIPVTQDAPSTRFQTLTPSRRLGFNDIIIFGTGDSLSATTLTSDVRFTKGLFSHFPINLTGPLALNVLERVHPLRCFSEPVHVHIVPSSPITDCTRLRQSGP